MDLVVFQNDATDVGLVGGKAAALAGLARAGFAPPAFFVIPAHGFHWDQDKATAAAGLQTTLDAALATLGPGPFAVRSSARQEDGAEHSHAGQFDTILNVEAKDVAEAAQKVWLSGFSDVVSTYRAVKSGGIAEAPAIIVQTMVVARAAGVAFSADPVSGQRDRGVISAVAGLGERLVSGEVDGESWVIDAEGNPCQRPEAPEVLSLDEASLVASLARLLDGHVFGKTACFKNLGPAIGKPAVAHNHRMGATAELTRYRFHRIGPTTRHQSHVIGLIHILKNG